MNIFHNKLWVSLLRKNEFPQFSFETHTLKQVKQQLTGPGPDFPGQVFYIMADPDPEWCGKFVSFLKMKPMASVEARINVCFQGNGKLQAFARKFRKYFKPLVAAGGVPVSPAGELLLIYRYENWDLAKGKVDLNESIPAAAMREMREETGIHSHTLGKKLRETYHIFRGRNAGVWRFKTTYWFLMPCKSREELIPQLEEGITDVRWFPAYELKASMPDTYPLIQEVLREVLYPF
ncbi:MAG: NUDIX domain-containing protein [Bacteroidia bacterium]|nr:NUDIX domain-containing protein [Bacteroidia bacterium]